MKPSVVKVKSIEYVEDCSEVCDLNIADNHNLFVCNEITENAVLAHNCLDENIHELASVCGDNHGYYGLGNLCIQYGFYGYISGKFGKEDRAGISKSPLDTPGLIEYCFDESTKVYCEKGIFPIREVVENPKDCGKVLSYNHQKSCVEYKEVEKTSCHETEEDMYEVEYEGGTIKLTGNHKLWCVNRNDYVRVDDLTTEDEVLLYKP